MKKRIIIIISLIASCASLLGQSIDKEKIEISYLKFPENPIPASTKTYSIQLKGNTEALEAINHNISKANSNLLKRIKAEGNTTSCNYPSLTGAYLSLIGYKTVENNGDFKIQVSVGPLIIKQKEVKQKINKCKKDQETVDCPSFYYKIGYSYPVHLKVSDKENKEIYSKQIRPSKNQLKTTFGNKRFGTYLTQNKLSDSYKNNEVRFKNEVEKALIINALFESRKEIESSCLYEKYPKTVMLVSAKKKHDYADLDATRNQVIDVLKNLNGNLPDDNAKKHLNEAIESWNVVLKELDLENKKARINKKIGGHIYYNIGVAYYFLDKLEKAGENIAKGKELKGPKAKLNRLASDIEKREKALKAHSGTDIASISDKIIPLDKRWGRKPKLLDDKIINTLQEIAPWSPMVSSGKESTQSKTPEGAIEKNNQEDTNTTDTESSTVDRLVIESPTPNEVTKSYYLFLASNKGNIFGEGSKATNYGYSYKNSTRKFVNYQTFRISKGDLVKTLGIELLLTKKQQFDIEALKGSIISANIWTTTRDLTKPVVEQVKSTTDNYSTRNSPSFTVGLSSVEEIEIENRRKEKESVFKVKVEIPSVVLPAGERTGGELIVEKGTAVILIKKK